MKRYEVDWVKGESWQRKVFTEPEDAVRFWMALVALEAQGGVMVSCATLFYLGVRGQRIFQFKPGGL